MAIRVVRGRTFTPADFVQGRRLVVVTDSWARRYVNRPWIQSARASASAAST